VSRGAHAQLAQLHDALVERTAQAVCHAPAKVIALRIGTSERHVRGIKAKEHCCGAAALFFLAQEDPQLRAWCVALMQCGPASAQGQALIHAIETRIGEDSTP
jgi:hypothetical protein